MKENIGILKLYAISPVHAGTESSTGAIDNPIQRERHTNWPHIQATSLKGALRDHFRKIGTDGELLNIIFGLDEQNDGKIEGIKESIHGAISISDAKIFAFPVRSNIAPFVWVTSPSVIKRFKRDLNYVGANKDIENLVVDIEDYNAIPINWDSEEKIILEDIVVNLGEKKENKFIKDNFSETERLLLVSDFVFKYLVENCTEVQTQIKIDEETGTAQEGALRYEELLPSDTVMYSIILFNNPFLNDEVKKNEVIKNIKIDEKKLIDNLKFEPIKKFFKEKLNNFIQIGGDQTFGRGIFKADWLDEKEEVKNE